MASCMLIRVRQRCGDITGHWVVWLFVAKLKWRRSWLSIAVIDDGGQNGCDVCCGGWCHTGIASGGNCDDSLFLREDFRDYLFDNEEVDLIMWTFLQQVPYIPHQLHFFSCWRAVSVLLEPCWILVNEVPWHTRSCTAVFFLEPQYDRILLRMDSNNHSRKIYLTTYP